MTPKSRAKDMKRSRDKKRDAGLVEFRLWCRPQDKELWAKEAARQGCSLDDWVVHLLNSMS